jgi:DNA-binding response OmpR family regulator
MTDILRTLIVDDEDTIRLFLEAVLKREGHIVTTAATGEQALAYLQDTPFDLAILDLMLGGRVDGQRLLEAIRWRWPAMVVIMMTGHGTLDSAVEAIREGVDGYILKPVESAEIRQVIQDAFARRERQVTSLMTSDNRSNLERGVFAINLETHQVSREGEEISLTPSEFTLLVYMMQNSHKVIDPKTLTEVVRQYKPDYLQEARQIIKWYVHRLRKKIEPDPSHPRYIVNVRGAGYMFVP